MKIIRLLFALSLLTAFNLGCSSPTEDPLTADTGNGPAPDTGIDGPDAHTPDGGADEDASGCAEGESLQDGRCKPAPFSALRGEVDVYRDSFGIPHIYARHLEDLFFVNGYVVARDRFPQLEFYRRISTGTLAEVVGELSSSAVDVDILFRMLGLRRSAERYWAQEVDQDSDVARVARAYAAGINAYLAQYRAGEVSQPAIIQEAFSPEATRDWTPVDSLAVGKLLAVSLTYYADVWIGAHEMRQNMLDTFHDSAADPQYQRRAGFFADTFRMAPASDTTHIDGFPTSGQALTRPAVAPRISKELLDNVQRLHRAMADEPLWEHINPLAARDRFSRGSNNWVLSGSLTESGHPNVANDPHLGLSTPTVFYPLHMKLEPEDGSEPLQLVGAAYVGAPGIVVGRNDHLAWGTTVGFYDYVDVYHEQITGSSDGDEPATVTFEGQEVPVERIVERIQVGRFGDIRDAFDLTVEWVPHHGPIIPTVEDHRPVPRTSNEALSVRWVGLEPSNDLAFLLDLWRSKTPDEVEAALDHYEVGSSNWVFGFATGEIFYSGQSKIPLRAPGALTFHSRTNPRGNAPFFVLPGDGSAEWEGFLSDEKIPHAFNPEKGYIITANNDQVGTTVDNDPLNDEFYLGGFYATGFRAERIEDQVEAAKTSGEKLSLDAQIALQDDGYDKVAERLVPHIVQAVDTVLDGSVEDDAHPDLAALREEIAGEEATLQALRDLLDQWDYDTPGTREPSGDDAARSAAATLFNTMMIYVLKNTYGDEFEVLGYFADDTWNFPRFSNIIIRAFVHLVRNTSEAATFDEATQESTIFDDLDTGDVDETRLTIFVRSMLQARDRLASSADFAEHWGRAIPSPRSADPADWIWGNLHGLRLGPLVPFVGTDWRRPQSGLPFYERKGGEFAVTPCNHGFDDFDFTCTQGSSLRMVHDMNPDDPVTLNAVPGGNVADPRSEFFHVQFDAWQAAEPQRMLTERSEVEADAVSAETFNAEGIRADR